MSWWPVFVTVSRVHERSVTDKSAWQTSCLQWTFLLRVLDMFVNPSWWTMLPRICCSFSACFEQLQSRHKWHRTFTCANGTFLTLQLSSMINTGTRWQPDNDQTGSWWNQHSCNEFHCTNYLFWLIVTWIFSCNSFIVIVEFGIVPMFKLFYLILDMMSTGLSCVQFKWGLQIWLGPR